MKAIAVTPLKPASARIVDVPEPKPTKKQLLVRMVEVGYCGTDVEINAGLYGRSPEGDDFLVLGHESLGVVEKAGKRTEGFRKGDLVVATVRRPCTEMCSSCEAEESDMCLTGHFVERGISGMHGYMQELVVESPDFLVRVPQSLRDEAVLLEPMSICEKAVLQSERIQQRLNWRPKKALVLGAGPVGMLAAFLCRLRGWGTFVAARSAAEASARPKILEGVGAAYVSTATTPLEELAKKEGPFDIVVEATGSAHVAFESMQLLAPAGIACLTSITGGGKSAEVPIDKINLQLVLGNQVVFGAVNANRSYFEAGVKDMRAVEKKWPGALAALITERRPYTSFGEAFEKKPSGIKSTVVFSS